MDKRIGKKIMFQKEAHCKKEEMIQISNSRNLNQDKNLEEFVDLSVRGLIKQFK